MKDTISALKVASADMLFPSETDAPFEVFGWGKANNTADTVRTWGGFSQDDACRGESLDDFFGDLLEEKEFQALKKAIEKSLADVKVYRCGSIEMTYFIVGTTRDGQLAGLKTTGVET